MKIIKKILSVIVVLLMLSVSVYAEETPYYSFHVSLDLNTGESTITEKNMMTETDFSNTLIRVIKTTPDGTSSEIYTGPLGSYDNGRWKNVDFSDNKPVVLYDWQTQNYCWVLPIQSVENAASASEVKDNLMPASSDLTIASQIKINGVNVGENGLRIVDGASMVCSLSISNNSTIDRGIKTFLATYTETGKLHNVSIYNIEIDAGEASNTEFTYQFDAENEYTGKLMFWDLMTNLMPIKASIDFSQTSGVNAYYYDTNNRLLQIDKMNGTSILFTYDNMGNLLTRTTRK